MRIVNTAQDRQLQCADGAVSLRIRLLGPVTVTIAGRPVAVPSKKARALLGYLALREGTAVSRGVLTGLLWGERGESQARASLRQTLSELRGALAESGPQSIIASKETITWATGSAWIDARVAETTAGSADNDALRDVADLFGGDLMEGLSVGEMGFEQWLAAERERFRLLACSIHMRVMERAEQSGSLEEALTYGLKLLSFDPLQENVHRALMRLYAAQGRHDAALAQYERCRRELSNQLGVRPEPETEDLARSIRASRRDGPGKPQGVASPAPELDNAILPSKPSIAVLPFQNMSGDPEQEYFVDGLTDDIITALSRISALWVIARTSTFTYKGKLTDVKRIAKELGVRYVMDGSVRRMGDRLRVTAQLIDATTGHQVWGERYDRSLTDLFDIQDDITRSVAASTETQVTLAERQAAESRPSTDFKARDLVARAWARVYDQTPDALAEASGLVEEAISIDPLNPIAYRVRGAVFLSRMWLGEVLRDAANVARALELARVALRLAPRDEWAHLLMVWAYMEAGRLEDAVAECELALEINPSSSVILSNLGACLGLLGRPQEAIDACRLALQLNPRDPSNFWRHSYIALAQFVAADYEAALRQSKKVARSRPHLQGAIIWAAAAAALGEADEARAAVEYCLAQRPDLRIGGVVPDIVLRFARDEDHERLLTLLREAGLPE